MVDYIAHLSPPPPIFDPDDTGTPADWPDVVRRVPPRDLTAIEFAVRDVLRLERRWLSSAEIADSLGFADGRVVARPLGALLERGIVRQRVGETRRVMWRIR